MNRKLLCLTTLVAFIGTIFTLTYLASAAPPGPFDTPPGFEKGNQSDQAEDAIDAHKPITPGGHYERLALIHYAKPPWAGKPDDEEPPEPDNSYYELLGCQWEQGGILFKIDLDYAPAGSEFEIEYALEAWDDVTATDLFDPPVLNSDAGPSTDTPDYINTVSWRRVVPPKAIAVTFIWYRTDILTDDGYYPIVDCDIVMNTNKKDWGIGEADAFDVRNIATHEAGHVVGLADLYEEQYRELTMYGYSSEGETQKCDLEEGDIDGAQFLYGVP